MFGIIGSIVVGFVVGLIARAVLPGNQSMGLLMTTVLGIAGSLLAKFAGQMLGLYAEGANAGWIASVVGAIVVLLIYGAVNKGKSGGGGGTAV